MTDKQLLRLAAVLVAGILAPVLDSTIVTIALHAIGTDFGASLTALQWVVTAYLLAMALAIPLAGWSTTRFGGRRMWIGALAVFLAGSVGCALAPSIGALIAFRAVQGAGAGLLIPIMTTLLIQAAAGRPLGKLMAAVALPALVGPILGPVVGGLIVNHLDWRWVFYVNVPICVAGLAAAVAGLPRDASTGRTAHLDVLGLLLLSPALAAIVYGLAEVGTHGGFAYAVVLGPLAAGSLLLVFFVRHALRRRDRALVDLRLFADRRFALSCALLFLTGVSLFGAMLLLPLYYQQVRGAGALGAGLLLAPQGVGALLSRGWLGARTDTWGPRPVIVLCTLLTAAGTVAFAFAGTHTAEWLLAVSLLVRGAGLGGITMAVMASAYTGMDSADVPHASTATRIAQQVGASFGAAIFAVVLATRLGAHPADVAGAFDDAFWWALALAALPVIPALLLPQPVSSRPVPAA